MLCCPPRQQERALPSAFCFAGFISFLDFKSSMSGPRSLYTWLDSLTYGVLHLGLAFFTFGHGFLLGINHLSKWKCWPQLPIDLLLLPYLSSSLLVTKINCISLLRLCILRGRWKRPSLNWLPNAWPSRLISTRQVPIHGVISQLRGIEWKRKVLAPEFTTNVIS